jgi:hypothetical protein
MRLSTRSALVIAAVTLGTVVSVAYVTIRAKAQQSARDAVQAALAREAARPYLVGLTGQLGGAVEVETPRPTAVYVEKPLTSSAAKTWVKLQEPIAFNFSQETPLEDVLKYVKSASHSAKEKGLTFYVDPIGLQEAERTMSSPIQLDVDEVPIATGLALSLKQLGLKFFVSPEGLVVITSVDSDRNDRVSDPSLRILEEMSALRNEVSALHKALDNPHAGGVNPSQAREIAELREELATLRRSLAAPPAKSTAESNRRQQ